MGAIGVEPESSKQCANAVAGRGAAWLPRDQGVEAALLHPRCQALDLRGLAGAVEAFESDE